MGRRTGIRLVRSTVAVALLASLSGCLGLTAHHDPQADEEQCQKDTFAAIERGIDAEDDEPSDACLRMARRNITQIEQDIKQEYGLTDEQFEQAQRDSR